MAEMEYDEYLQIWSMSAQSALECFGLTAATHEVIVIKDKPETARELERYKPETKLFGIRSRISLTADTITLDQIGELWADLTKHESAGVPIYGVLECVVALGLGDQQPSEDAKHRARGVCAAILNTRIASSRP